MNTDMDLMLAYNKPVKESKHTIVQKWALGHADKKKKRQLIDNHSNWKNIEYDEEENESG